MPTDAAGRRQPQRLLGYVDSRKFIYVPLYCDLVQGKAQFEELRHRHLRGENLLIVEIDGPHRESLAYYQSKYCLERLGVDPEFIDAQNTVSATSVANMRLLLHDERHPFGHGYCLALALQGPAAVQAVLAAH
jgi:hypothetical protein